MKNNRLSQEMLETVSGLYKIGVISKKTMHDFKNIKLLELSEMSAEDIKKLRKKENVSQNLFAKYLNISVSTIVLPYHSSASCTEIFAGLSITII